MTIQLFEPYCDGGEIHQANECGEHLDVAGCDAPELLQFAEEALNTIALLVEPEVMGA